MERILKKTSGYFQNKPIMFEVIEKTEPGFPAKKYIMRTSDGQKVNETLKLDWEEAYNIYYEEIAKL